MTATDELHGQLDTGYPHTLRPELHKALMNRGIDYWVAQGITFWNRDDGCECLAYGYQADGVPKLAIKVVGFTDPEQAIAATVGCGTCRMVYNDLSNLSRCTACGWRMEGVPMYYCPRCGRKVVDG